MKTLSQIYASLNYLVTKEAGEFIIFENPQSKKFVQVVLLEDGLLCDVPLSELSREEGSKLKSLSSKNIGEMYEGSYNLWFKLADMKQATEWVDKIFVDVFALPRPYSINVVSA